MWSIPFAKGNGQTSLPMPTAIEDVLETYISKFVIRLERHENHHDRETDGAISLEIVTSETEICVTEVWRKYLHR